MDATEEQRQVQARVFWTKSMRILGVAAILGLITVACLMNFFNPLDIGPYGLLSFFVAVYLVVAATFITMTKAAMYLVGKILRQWQVYSAAIAAFAPIMLLALSTLGQLRLTDFVLVILFESIAIFYIFRRF